METLLYVGLGGFAGANLRYWVSIIIGRFDSSIPLGTLLVNFIGSVLLAVFIEWSARQIALDTRARLFVTTGFFGAFTTFSTFANESVALWEDGAWHLAVGNILGTNVICVLGVLVGLQIGRML